MATNDQEPGLYSECVVCGHTFSEHYMTYDKEKHGCHVLYTDGTSPPLPYNEETSREQCSCLGFAITWIPSPS